MKQKGIYIFTVVVALCGWLGVLVDGLLTEQEKGSSLGMLLWLVFPFLTVILLRFKNKDWKNNGFGLHLRGNVKWYGVAIFLNILVAAVCIGIAAAFGTITYQIPKLDVMGDLILTGILSQLVKNVFEEYAWRGYLTQKLGERKINDTLVYLIVGVVWALWHLPYYLVFLDKSTLGTSSRGSMVISNFIILTLWSVLYVELYRITKSVWPCIILHAISNVIQNVFIFQQDGIQFSSQSADLILNPIDGVLASLLFLLAGLLLRRYRIKKELKNTRSICYNNQYNKDGNQNL